MDDHDPLIERLRALGRAPVDPATASNHLSAMAAVRATRRQWTRAKVGAAFFAGLVVGGTGLASAGALPAPVQDAAHSALSTVGVDVPKGHQPARYSGPECGSDPTTHQPFRNHGQYVRAHAGAPTADASRCGKPIQAGTGGPDTSETSEPGEPSEASGGGPPPSAHGHGAQGQGHGHGHGAGVGNGDGNNSPDAPDAISGSQRTPTTATRTTAAPTTAAPTTTTAPAMTAAPTTTISTSTSTTSTTAP